MIVNPDKFQAMILSFNKKGNKYTLYTNDSHITSEDFVIRFSVGIDNKLNFEKHISTLCRKLSKQLNAISKIQHYIGKKKKRLKINSFVYSNFMNCSLTWHFCSMASQLLLEKTENSTMEVQRQRTFALEIFKTFKNINPNFMKEIIYISPHNIHRRHDIIVQSQKTTKYGDKSLRVMSPHLWNLLPE